MTKVGQELEMARTEVENLISAFQSHEGELAFQGIAIEHTIAELNKELAELERLAATARRAGKRHAQACAEIAQTDEEYFEVLCKVMDGLAAECPSHPLVRQWVDIRQFWAEQLLTRN